MNAILNSIQNNQFWTTLQRNVLISLLYLYTRISGRQAYWFLPYFAKVPHPMLGGERDVNIPTHASQLDPVIPVKGGVCCVWLFLFDIRRCITTSQCTALGIDVWCHTVLYNWFDCRSSCAHSVSTCGMINPCSEISAMCPTVQFLGFLTCLFN